jgi:hypothetical protein
MKAVIEAHLHATLGALGRGAQALDIGVAEPPGLLDQNVRAGVERATRNVGELIVRHSDHDDVAARSEQILERCSAARAELGGQRLRHAFDNVITGDEPVAAECSRALVTDHAAADEAHAESCAHEYSEP